MSPVERVNDVVEDAQTVGPAASAIAPSVLANLPDVSSADTQREWLLSGADELFRGIYTRAGVGNAEALAICSAISGEGKTTVAVGLGTTIAQDYPERRVVVVETDFERPVLAEDFEVESYPGLADCLMEDLPVQIAVRPTMLPNLHLVPAGGPASKAGRLLRSHRMAVALQALRESYDLVILDVPAVLVNSDALYMVDLSDSVLFVVRAGLTPSPVVRRAISQLDDTRGLLRGVVLNGGQSKIPGWLRRLCGL
jgi:Mrp family chromosome partitioning ATPase